MRCASFAAATNAAAAPVLAPNSTSGSFGISILGHLQDTGKPDRRDATFAAPALRTSLGGRARGFRAWQRLKPLEPAQHVLVARALNDRGVASLLFDLLTPAEEIDRINVFNIALLASRLVDVIGWLDSQPGLAFGRCMS